MNTDKLKEFLKEALAKANNAETNCTDADKANGLNYVRAYGTLMGAIETAIWRIENPTIFDGEAS